MPAEVTLTDITETVNTLLAASNDVRFELGHWLCVARDRLGDAAKWRDWRTTHLGDTSRSWVSELMTVYQAFPDVSERHLELSWSAHREAIRWEGYILSDGRPLTPTEILTEFPTVAAIRGAGEPAKEPTTRRKAISLDLLERIEVVLAAATREVTDKQLLKEAQEVHEAVVLLLNPSEAK